MVQFDTSKDHAVICAHSLHMSKVITIEGCFPCMGASLSVYSCCKLSCILNETCFFQSPEVIITEMGTPCTLFLIHMVWDAWLPLCSHTWVAPWILNERQSERGTMGEIWYINLCTSAKRVECGDHESVTDGATYYQLEISRVLLAKTIWKCFPNAQ